MASGERTLSERELNRALLARQLLLERSRAALPRAVERIAGIQAQYAPSMYIGLWTRLEGFERPQLDRALERRTLVQGTSLRSTIHLLTPRDWWTFAAAITDERRQQWLRTRRETADAAGRAAAARRARPLFSDPPVPRKLLQETLGLGAPGISGINAWLSLVRVPPSGTWDRRRADLFALASDWIGPAPKLAQAEATVDLVSSYLRGFGPATPTEIHEWAGVGVKAIRAALAKLELRRFRAENGDELVDLPRLPIPDPGTPAAPRLLPVWDATLLVHARRTQILPEEHRSKVFSPRTPQSVNTFLVDGRVAGTWRFEKGRIELSPFGSLARADRRALEQEAERLAEFHRR
jgi:hypothetical protein